MPKFEIEYYDNAKRTRTEIIDFPEEWRSIALVKLWKLLKRKLYRIAKIKSIRKSKENLQ